MVGCVRRRRHTGAADPRCRRATIGATARTRCLYTHVLRLLHPESPEGRQRETDDGPDEHDGCQAQERRCQRRAGNRSEKYKDKRSDQRRGGEDHRTLAEILGDLVQSVFKLFEHVH